MSNQFSSDEEELARLVREAGDPSVLPDPLYAEKLRATILDRAGLAETAAPLTETVREANVSLNVSPIGTLERTRQMKRIAKFAVAATVLVGLGILTSWLTIGGGSTNIAFANVADALDSLQSATFDMTSKSKGEEGLPSATATGKGFFLAPSHQRIEMSVVVGPAKIAMNQVTIVDGQAAKILMLMPSTKMAVSMDMKKMREDMKNSGKGSTPDVFEMVRRLVREGSSGTGAKSERLGRKEIDGREAVGFRTRADMMDMTLWADPETAWPIRIEVVMDMMAGVHVVMNNFRYNVDLDPSLFSLETPAGYSTQTMEMAMPVEEDLLRTLRTLADHSNGEFPLQLGMNKEVMERLIAAVKPEMARFEAEMNKLAAKHGGKDKLKAKYGKEPPAAVIAETTKAMMPILQKQMQGITFYMMLKPENDPHYVASGVKLGTTDLPILWYKPTGADKYRVIYADLSVEDMTPDEVKKLPEVKAK